MFSFLLAFKQCWNLDEVYMLFFALLVLLLLVMEVVGAEKFLQA
jgi:hypothetical protein